MADYQSSERPDAHPVCGLCGRPVPPDVRQSRHHLTPKLKGGKGGAVVILHQICHNEIHATLTEAEIARDYNTLEALRMHPHLARLIRWLARKDPGFYRRTAGGRRKR